MEILQQWCKMRFSFRNATLIVCFFNLIIVLLLLQGFLSASSTGKLAANQPNSVQLKYVKESEELRRAMEPLELIKRVREIQQEVYVKPEAVEQKETKQATAVDLISRLNNFRTTDSGSMKVPIFPFFLQHNVIGGGWELKPGIRKLETQQQPGKCKRFPKIKCRI
ncbi:hypothetical protein RHMOL_Rhmol02G0051200 [Rhododendron molle]|uniref:Uncharacterized protein n=1 Tax=Rhododendron molle TaxID=49168 RepID=A0ACC0PNB3_RHOML|nr:hypothetical protein RHMOL_Rhmol02G0051200 [Rhododendron molle]